MMCYCLNQAEMSNKYLYINSRQSKASHMEVKQCFNVSFPAAASPFNRKHGELERKTVF